jgi:hypothetical protein
VSQPSGSGLGFPSRFALAVFPLAENKTTVSSRISAEIFGDYFKKKSRDSFLIMCVETILREVQRHYRHSLTGVFFLPLTIQVVICDFCSREIIEMETLRATRWAGRGCARARFAWC